MSGIRNTQQDLIPGSSQAASDYGAPGVKANVPITKTEILPTIKPGGRTETRLPQFATEPVQSVDVTITSADRVSGTPFDFVADIGATIFRPRLFTVDSIVLPKLYNVTPLNNTIRIAGAITSGNGIANAMPVVEFTLPPGYYDINTFSREFVDRANEAVARTLTTLGSRWLYRIDIVPGEQFPAPRYSYTITTNFSMTFEPRTNRFLWMTSNGMITYVLEDVPNPATFGFEDDVQINWWFVDGGNFNSSRGRNFIPFGTHPAPQGQAPTPPVPNTQSEPNGISSGIAGMQYTRFCTISSAALNRFNYGESRVSRIAAGGGGGRIISVVDTSLFQILGDGFAGSFLPAQVPNSPFINVNNAQAQLESNLDFVVQDEFGDSLDLS